jgi:heptosyltransferase-2
VEERHFREQRATLPGSADGAVEEVCRALSMESLQGCRYRVLHMGSAGSALREWPPRSWRILAERLTSEGHRLVFTGIGEGERRNIEAVMKGLKGCSDACDKLRWQGFVEILRHAEIVYCVETSAGHIAAAADVPCVGIYGGIHDFHRWKPRGKYSELVTHPVPCAPCFIKTGCEEMECIRDVSPDRVHEAGEILIARRNAFPER